MTDELESRLRAALRAAGRADPAADSRLVRAALAGLPAPTPRRRRIRALRPTLAVIVVLVVVALITAILIAMPAEPPAGPAPVPGVQTTFRVLPDEAGADPEPVAEQLAGAISVQADRIGIEGLEVEVEGDRVVVVVPGTDDLDWASNRFLPGRAVAAYRRDSVIALSADLEVVATAAERVPGGPPFRYYRISPAPAGARTTSDFLSAPSPTVEDLPPLPDGIPPRRGARVVRLPAGVAIAYAGSELMPGGDPGFVALADPVLTPGDVADVSAEGSRLRVVPRPEASPRLAASDGAGGFVLTFTAGLPQVIGARFTGVDRDDQALLFQTPSAEILAADLAGGGVAGGVVVEDERVVGPTLPRPGTRPAEMPRFVSDSRGDPMGDSFRPDPETVRLVLTERGSGRLLWNYRNRRGEEMITLGGADGSAQMSGGCPRTPESPDLFVCSAGFGPGARTVVGRAGDDVRVVRAVLSDATSATAMVDNGFFLLTVPRRSSIERMIAEGPSGELLAEVDRDAPEAVVWR